MRVNLTLLLLGALVVAGIGSAEALNGDGGRPMGISMERFHDNCLGQQGRFVALRGQVVCKVAADVAIVCQYGPGLGNCLWTGPIKAATLAGIFADRGLSSKGLAADQALPPKVGV
jgi:hypothetical protein